MEKHWAAAWSSSREQGKDGPYLTHMVPQPEAGKETKDSQLDKTVSESCGEMLQQW